MCYKIRNQNDQRLARFLNCVRHGYITLGGIVMVTKKKAVKRVIKRKIAKKAIAKRVVKKAVRKAVAKKIVKKAVRRAVAKKVVKKAVRRAVAKKVVKKAVRRTVAKKAVRRGVVKARKASHKVVTRTSHSRRRTGVKTTRKVQTAAGWKRSARKRAHR